MTKQYFEDFPVGRILEFGDYAITAHAIEAYRSMFDPAPAASSLSGIASGWHVCAALSRLACDGFLLNSSSAGGQGVPAFDYAMPVVAGDRLRCRATVLAARASRTKPQLGFVDFRYEIIRYPDDPVAVMDGGVIFGVRDPAEPQPATPRPQSPALAGSDTALPPISSRLPDWNDLQNGAIFDLGEYVFEQQEVLAFAAEFDPQPFHLDDSGAAGHSHFGRIAASGWHTAAALAARLQASRSTPSAAMRGFRDLVWSRPVHVGDRLTFKAVLVGKSVDPVSSTPIVVLRCMASNQDGTRVLDIVVEEEWHRAR